MFVLLLLSTVWLTTSCVDDINRDEDYTESIVVNCFLSNQSEQYLSVTTTNRVGESTVFREADFEEAVLYEEAQAVGTFVRKGYNKWKVTYIPQAGKQYMLKVILSDQQEITAYTTMPFPCEVQAQKSIEHTKQPFTQHTFNHPMWVSCLNSDDYITLSTDLSTLVLCAEVGTNHEYVDTFNQEGSLSDIIQTSSYGSLRYYIRLNAAPERVKTLSFDIQAAIRSHYAFSFITASYEYDRYMKTTFEKMNLYRDDEDIIQWFDEQTVYSNIENGVGIFAAYNETIFRFYEE